MHFFKNALLAITLCPVSPALLAQAIILPKAILFTGVPAYSQAELLAFTGLTPGANSTVAEVQAAAQKLNDTGLFSDVHFQSEPRGLVFSLKSMPEANLLPVHFTNFVWWSPQQINVALKARVPLYLGSIPTAGNMQHSVSAALKTILTEKGVTASIVAMPSAATRPPPTPSTSASTRPWSLYTRSLSPLPHKQCRPN